MKKKVKKEGWFLNRNYLHFDCPLSFDNASLAVKNPKQVAQHPFLPFLTFDVTTIKYKKNLITSIKEKVSKKRPICYSSHIDGYIYSYYAMQLSILYEKKLSCLNLASSVLAFRTIDGKSNIDFAKKAFNDILNHGECTAIAFDFSKFFDTLNHDILKDKWCNLLNVSSLPDDHYNIYKSLTKYSTVDKNKVYNLFNISKNNPKTRPFRICSMREFREKVRKTHTLIKPNPTIAQKKGIPQGSSLSALLSNIYMLDFDEKMFYLVDSLGGKYYRYCDDILIVVNTDDVSQVENYFISLADELKLVVNDTKTLKSKFTLDNGVLCVDKELQYLGFMFNGRSIYLRSASISRYHQKLKRSLSLSKKTMNKYNEIRKIQGKEAKPLFKNKLYEKYSHLGKSNFIRYGLRAKNIMNSPEIKKQIKQLTNKLNEELKL